MLSPKKVIPVEQSNKLFTLLKREMERSVLTLQSLKPHRSSMEISIIVDYFIFSLIFYTGLRISEALTLEIDDIGPDFLIIRSENSKNKRSGHVYFGKKTKLILDEYLSLREKILATSNEGILFPSQYGKATYMSRSNLHTRFKGWLLRCGLPQHYSLHSLRHTYATKCLDSGLSLTFVRDQLRHSNISITSKYLHLTKANRDRLKEIF